ncbi:hypothetical protein F441_14252 [Phytophthora nicotianae CJ01A1]|uniref:Uncharacterized protein n=5 Tax=Phytophthora nicotianae TaxID=4792 RepID=W2PWG7_PHYN3|nr:hypothetical protein PPTG_14441 [Phytophthora nicotianae INRA-310]ETK80267.1 hypothetical protein L915_14010 [Phytophthora nicotianae]ETO68900.1 hypothetical protein F444_14375 [Phytophthora nicotianae P1976]ETP10012.1 hypothetical protein F441_14252 [Phytophthora nicotianae CJ01A1]ETP38133.1 hypothetical protein F442_14216 [Phytophthora nicotianae P10297]ETL33687.1 hypothetical protein L916_13912 [Phytophthora nicotianae]
MPALMTGMTGKPPLRWHACTPKHKDRAGDPYVETFVAQRAVCVPLRQAGCQRALDEAVNSIGTDPGRYSVALFQTLVAAAPVALARSVTMPYRAMHFKTC